MEEKKKKNHQKIKQLCKVLIETNHYKKLSYIQRWRLKVYQWGQKIKLTEKYIPLLSSKIENLTKKITKEEEIIKKDPQQDLDLSIAISKQKLLNYNKKLQFYQEMKKNTWNKINIRLQTLTTKQNQQENYKKTYLSKQYKKVKLLKEILIQEFYPEQLN